LDFGQNRLRAPFDVDAKGMKSLKNGVEDHLPPAKKMTRTYYYFTVR
jgi:hypothetical protein